MRRNPKAFLSGLSVPYAGAIFFDKRYPYARMGATAERIFKPKL